MQVDEVDAPKRRASHGEGLQMLAFFCDLHYDKSGVSPTLIIVNSVVSAVVLELLQSAAVCLSTFHPVIRQSFVPWLLE